MAQLTKKKEEAICEAWNKLLSICIEAKKDFCELAREAMSFYAKPNHNFSFDSKPDMPVTINKVYELVSIFGPHFYAQDPRRNVEPRRAGDPAIAEIQTALLNYTPREFNLKTHSEEAITQSIITGRGALITGLDARSGLPISIQQDINDLVLDPSERKWYNGYFFMRIHRDKPIWEVSRKFGKRVAKRLEDGSRRDAVHGILKEAPEYSEPEFDAEENGKERQTYDAPRVTYIEVYSKMGIGLRGVKVPEINPGKTPAYVAGNDSRDYVRIVYEPTRKVVMQIDKWPVPYWADEGPYSWPISFFDSGENRNHTWPISIITPALGEQRWLNWGASFLLSHAKMASRSIAVAPTSLPPGVEGALKSNRNWIVVKTDTDNPDQNENYLRFIEFPDLSPQFVEMLRYAEDLFEKRTGLYELMYGQSRKQYRSATEADLKGEFGRVRIDAIAQRTEEWQTEIARKEAIAARYAVSPEQILPIVGPDLAQMWKPYEEGDLERVMREFDYSVVAGSMRKRTAQQRLDIAAERLERFGEFWINTGNIEAMNQAIMEWETANGNPNPERFLAKAMPPPPQEEQAPPPAPQEVIAIENGQPVFGPPPEVG